MWGLFNLMEVARKNKIKKFIFASSSSIYGSNTKAPLKKILILAVHYNFMELQKKLVKFF